MVMKHFNAFSAETNEMLGSMTNRGVYF
jgi:hypothetical protein